MIFQTHDELIEHLVTAVSTCMLLGAIRTGRSQNAQYYWRWNGFVSPKQLTVLFPDIEERLTGPRYYDGTEMPNLDETDKVYVYQLEKWYNMDFSDAYRQVSNRYTATLDAQQAALREVLREIDETFASY